MTIPLRVALVGNPNAGKSTLFNALSGLRQHVGNYPGVTVDLTIGRAILNNTLFEFIDLPGTYSLAPRSPDEMVAVRLLLGQIPNTPPPDVVLAIVDASNLERHLFLTTQLADLGRPIVLALNMIDVAKEQGIQIDPVKLAEQLGWPVVPIQANTGQGVSDLITALVAARGATPPVPVPLPVAFHAQFASLRRFVPDTAEYLLQRALLDDGGYCEKVLLTTATNPETIRAKLQKAREELELLGLRVATLEAKSRYSWLRERLAPTLSRPNLPPVTFSDRMDRILTHRLWGMLFFFVVMFLMFQSIFKFAEPIKDVLTAGQEGLAGLVGDPLPTGPLRSLLVDGIIGGVGGVLIFLPQILILFAFIAVLEDCGYMARAAFLMDRVMARCGLSGKSFIPLLSSVACAVPGVMATRVIENRRDRLATILVAPLMSCSARLPVYMLFIGAFLKDGYPSWLPGL
ncbi:MAG: ferrous iron transport protein B, partial [Gemmataceae bacterium]